MSQDNYTIISESDFDALWNSEKTKEIKRQAAKDYAISMRSPFTKFLLRQLRKMRKIS